mmetsp:Transcript_41743/g.50840  ORF Transcript_41743/g.50840 Transcript_41743/m.50840 type:complete len:124 (-) Transcript_41743:123-494(-)
MKSRIQELLLALNGCLKEGSSRSFGEMKVLLPWFNGAIIFFFFLCPSSSLMVTTDSEFNLVILLGCRSLANKNGTISVTAVKTHFTGVLNRDFLLFNFRFDNSWIVSAMARRQVISYLWFGRL